MDKKDYIDTLKQLNMRPDKIRIKERKEEILFEDKLINGDERQELLKELFVQTSEIESMPAGKERDIQILRLGIIAELDASNLYEKFALLASDARVKKTMLDVSREEKVHFGEFEALVEMLDPEFEKAEEEGEDEVEELVKKK